MAAARTGLAPGTALRLALALAGALGLVAMLSPAPTGPATMQGPSGSVPVHPVQALGNGPRELIPGAHGQGIGRGWPGSHIPGAAAAGSMPPSRLAIAERIAQHDAESCEAFEIDGSRRRCTVRFGAVPGRRVNAWAQGSQVMVSEAALRRLTEQEFALLAGHEIAHLRLRHNTISPGNELAADRLGAQLACQAGYDPERGASLFRYLKSGATHPQPALRRLAVQAAGCAAGRDRPD